MSRRGDAGQVARLAVHACTVCAGLPVRPFDERDVDPAAEYRPARPRPAPHGGPRSRRCSTHERARARATRARSRDVRRARLYSLDPVSRAALVDVQGGVCPICGCGLDAAPDGRERRSATDHDHGCCPEPPTCGRCTRGILCARCNGQLLGALAAMPGGELLAAWRVLAYLLDPPAVRLRREQGAQGQDAALLASTEQRPPTCEK